MNLNDEMIDMMKFYEFYKQMKAYEKNNEFSLGNNNDIYFDSLFSKD